MSRRKKRQLRFVTFAFLPVLLALAALVPAFLSINNTADATSASDWTKVKGYVASYFTNQYDAGQEGEAGYIVSPGSLNTRINSDGNTAILGEGDDAANAPVLIDNLGTQATWIPGTSERCQWNVGTGLAGYSANCFDAGMVDRVKAKADAHAAAGFSTDIVDYCVSGKTEAPTTGGWAYIAQTGGLRSDGSIVNVYGLAYGRNGWTNTAVVYNRTGAIGPATAAATFTPPTVNAASTNCNSTVSDVELVRCQVQQSIYNGAVNGMTGGNVGNGQAPGGVAPAATLTTGAVIDTRTGTPGNTVSAYTTYQLPIDTLFTTGLANIPNPAPANGILVGARTPMVGGIVAEGLKMLGYTMSTGGFINDGLKSYNNSLSGGWVSDGGGRVALTSVAPDTAAPTITVGPTVSNLTSTSADITRTTNEPATSKITLTGTDGHVVNINNTVLNAIKTVTVSGLHPGVNYSGTLTAYDGQANASAAAAIVSFLPPDVIAPITTDNAPAGWQTADFNVTLTCTDDSGSCASTSYSVDGGATQTGTTVAINTDGDHTIEYWSADPTGNVETPHKTVHALLDKSAPVISNLAPTGDFTSDATIFTAEYTDGSGSGINTATAMIHFDGPPIPMGSCTITPVGISCPKSGLTVGSHDLLVMVTDVAGNYAQITGTINVVDSVAPSVANTSAAGIRTTNSFTITGSYSDPSPSGGIQIARLSVDGTTSFLDPNPCTFTGSPSGTVDCAVTLADGDYQTVIGVTDIAGHAANALPPVNIMVDTANPATTDNAPAGWQTADLIVTLNCTDATSGCAGTTYEVDGAATQSGTAVAINTDGEHTITYRSTDNAGHTEGTRTQFVKLDKTAPAFFNNSPTGTSGNTGPTISVDYSDGTSGIDIATVSATVDGSALNGCSITNAGFSCATSGLGNGIHNVIVNASDVAGNPGSTSWAFTVNTSAPVISAYLPNAGSWTSNNSPTIAMQYHAGGTIDSASLILDGGIASANVSGPLTPQTEFSLTYGPLADGQHTVAGDVGVGGNHTPAAWVFGVDTTAPVTTDNAPAGWANANTTVTLACTDAGSGCASTSWTADNGGGSGSGDTVAVINDGVTTITYHSVDNAGNAEADKTATVRIDRTIPVISNNAPAGWITTASTIEADITELGGSGVNPAASGASIQFDGGSYNPIAGCTITDTHISCPLPALSEGSYVMFVNIWDNAGNNNDWSNHFGFFFVDTTAPVTTDNAPAAPQNADFTVDLTCTDGGSGCASTYYTVDGGAVQVGNSVAINTEGDHTIVFHSTDTVGHAEADRTIHAILDKTAPATTDNAQLGWQNTFTITDVTLNCTDAGGTGCASTVYTVDGGAPQTGNTVHVDTEGDHTIVYHSVDNAGNAEADHTAHTKLDLTSPVTANDGPAGWTNADVNLTLSCTDTLTGSGCSNTWWGVDGPAATIGVPPVVIPITTEGDHVVNYFSQDSAGYNESIQSAHVRIDKTAPQATNLLPNGSVTSSSVTLSADLADLGSDPKSGIDTEGAEIHLDGSATALTGCTTNAASISCPASIGVGDHTFTVTVMDNAGNSATSAPQTFSLTQLNYYFPWYDNNGPSGMKGDWIMMSNQGSGSADVKIYIGAIGDADTPVAEFDAAHGNAIPAGGQAVWQSPTTVTGGPVRVVSTNGESLLVSQRVLYKDSFNEIVAADEAALSETEFDFTWYDNNPANGMNGNWILVGNVGTGPAEADIFVDGNKVATMNIPAGGHQEWQSPDLVTGGPVQVKSTSGQKLIVSQRVLFKDAFNEVLGVGRSKLDTEAYFTWYDNNRASGMNGNWVLAANMGTLPTDIQIFIDDTGDGATPVATMTNVQPGETAFWQSDTVITDGPVRAISTNTQSLMVSQRVIYKNSFEEVQGQSPNDMGDNADFNWYDLTPASGMVGDWILIGNWSATPRAATIDIGGGAKINPVSGTPTFSVTERHTITPKFDGQMGGPVRVSCDASCTGQKMIISQRVLYKDSFNEVVGRPRK